MFELEVELLTTVRNTIEKGWCKGWFAKDDKDGKCETKSPRACKWCLHGAFFAHENYENYKKANKEAIYNVLNPIIRTRAQALGKTTDLTYNLMVWYNDEVAESKEDILFLIDEGIKKLSE